MEVTIETDKSGLWYVDCPRIALGPYPTKEMAREVKDAIEEAYNQGREEIQKEFRKLIGAMPTHVGD